MQTADKGIKKVYFSLAYCRVMAQRWRGHGDEGRAVHYDGRAQSLRNEIKRRLRKKSYPPLVRCVVFYPGESWQRYEFWTSRPEAAGYVSPGMQSMIDGLLKKSSQAATTPQITNLPAAGASQMPSYF